MVRSSAYHVSYAGPAMLVTTFTGAHGVQMLVSCCNIQGVFLMDSLHVVCGCKSCAVQPAAVRNTYWLCAASGHC